MRTIKTAPQVNRGSNSHIDLPGHDDRWNVATVSPCPEASVSAAGDSLASHLAEGAMTRGRIKAAAQPYLQQHITPDELLAAEGLSLLKEGIGVSQMHSPKSSCSGIVTAGRLGEMGLEWIPGHQQPGHQPAPQQLAMPHMALAPGHLYSPWQPE